jgi:ribose-phosphate pyrophosphokinase
MHLIGDVRGRSTLIVDDIIDTAGTLVKTAEALLNEGATQVFAACTHRGFIGPGRRADCEVRDYGSGGDGLRAVERRREEDGQD